MASLLEEKDSSPSIPIFAHSVSFDWKYAASVSEKNHHIFIIQLSLFTAH